MAIRPRSRGEIFNHLRKYTSDTTLINQIIDRLTTQKFLDDEKFAAWLVESRSRSRPRGKRLLLQELKSKGVDQMTIIDNFMTTIDEKTLAQKALEKKLPLWSKLPYRDFRLKATHFLYSRGFSWEVIEPVLKKAYSRHT